MKRDGLAEVQGLIYRALAYNSIHETSYRYDSLQRLSRDLICSACYLASGKEFNLDLLFKEATFLMEFYDYKKFISRIKKTKLKKLLMREKSRKGIWDINLIEDNLQLNHSISRSAPFDPFKDEEGLDLPPSGPLFPLEWLEVMDLLQNMDQLENRTDPENTLVLLQKILKLAPMLNLPTDKIRKIEESVKQLKKVLVTSTPPIPQSSRKKKPKYSDSRQPELPFGDF